MNRVVAAPFAGFVLFCAVALAQGYSPGEHRANVPVSARNNSWYLDVPESHAGPVELYHVDEPASVVDADSGTPLQHSFADGTLHVERPESTRRIAVSWTNTAWDKQMQAFAEEDRAQKPGEGGILFVGSSTIVGWDLKRFFPGLDALNRGFGGSEFWDAVHYADKAILPYRPSTVVVYDGDNDIAKGKSPERVFADFEELARKIRFHLPETRIIVLSIKPSIARWDKWNRMRQVNAMMAEYVKTQPNMAYVDIAGAILGDGKPRPEFFKEDGLHLNEQGYEACSALLRPMLAEREKT